MKKIFIVAGLIFLASNLIFAIDDTSKIKDSEFFDIDDSKISTKDVNASSSSQLNEVQEEAIGISVNAYANSLEYANPDEIKKRLEAARKFITSERNKRNFEKALEKTEKYQKDAKKNHKDYDKFLKENNLETEDFDIFTEDTRRKQLQTAKKYEDFVKKQQEAKKQRELAKKQQEEAKKKAELAKKQQENARKKAELAKKQQENARKKAELAKKQEEDAKKKELEKKQEEARKQAELAKQQEEEAKKQAELAKKQEEEAKKQAELAKQQEEEAKKQAELAKKQEEEARKQAELAKKQEQEEAKKQAELAKKQQQEEAKKQAELAKQEEEEAKKQQAIEEFNQKELEEINAKRMKFLEIASSYRGIPYRSGGMSPSGFDCSGYVGYVVKNNLGITLPRTARDIYSSVDKIKKEELEPGDLVFFKGGSYVDHVGIYAGKYTGSGKYNGVDCFWNAANAGTRQGIVISYFTEPYWSRTYYASGRILPSAVEAAKKLEKDVNASIN